MTDTQQTPDKHFWLLYTVPLEIVGGVLLLNKSASGDSSMEVSSLPDFILEFIICICRILGICECYPMWQKGLKMYLNEGLWDEEIILAYSSGLIVIAGIFIKETQESEDKAMWWQIETRMSLGDGERSQGKAHRQPVETSGSIQENDLTLLQENTSRLREPRPSPLLLHSCVLRV